MTQDQGEMQLIGADPEVKMALMLHFSGKGLKVAIINMSQKLRPNIVIMMNRGRFAADKLKL